MSARGLRRAFVFVLAVLAEVPASRAARVTGLPVQFVAEVVRGQGFEREIGVNLVFRLIPREYGWTISVGTRATSQADFSAVVTPPFRGMNHRDIEGWHFRNVDNSGPNEPGPKNMNAPQQIREFAFVTNESDYRVASETLGALLWPSSPGEREMAERRFESVEARAAHGRLTILGSGTLWSGSAPGSSVCDSRWNCFVRDRPLRQAATLARPRRSGRGRANSSAAGSVMRAGSFL